jgi:rubrerythrin
VSRSASEAALIRLLRLAHSGELAAARAHEGHAASARDETERTEIEEIRREALEHRRCLGEMLDGLGASPSAGREGILGFIEATLSQLCRLTGRLLPVYGAALLATKSVKEYDDAAVHARAAGRDELVAPLLAMAEAELEHERYFKAKVRAHPLGDFLPLPGCTRGPAPEAGPDGRRQAHRRRALVVALVASLLAALLVRVPLLAVPGYEAGMATGLAAALAACFLAFELARSRPLHAEVKWGVLRRTPGEAVYEEARAVSLAVAPVIILPLFLLITQAARTGCRWAPGVSPFLFVALPAAFGGAALGLLFGSLTRKRLVALGFLALVTLASVLTSFAEALAGPRHVVHDLLLGPVSIGAYMGYDRGLSFPTSVSLHRLFSIIAFSGLLAFAAWWRCRSDAPPAAKGTGPDAEDGGWSASRADDATRARFLLRHHRRGPRRLLALLGLLALPFLLNPHACGLLSGRPRLQDLMPAVHETAHFRLHHAPGTNVEAHLERLAVEHEHAWQQVTEWLEIEPEWKVDAWLHPDDESLHQTTGARGYVFAAPWNREYHAIVRDGRVSQLRHELVHVLAADFGAWPFRASWSTGLIEGLATALDEGYARVPEAHESIAAVHAVGHVPPAARLTSITGFAGSDMDLSYRAAASFVGYLLREHGPGPFKQAYGASVQELGAGWLGYLESEVETSVVEAARARRRFDPETHPAFHRRACPRLGTDRPFTPPGQRARLLALADRPADAADAWCEAYRASADPRHLDAAARQRVRAGELEAALALVDRALSAPGLAADREIALLRRRSLLLASLDRADEAAGSLQLAARAVREDARPDSPGAPGDAVLEQLRLDWLALNSPYSVDHAVAALQVGEDGAEGLSAQLLSRWPDAAPLLRLALLASRPAAGGTSSPSASRGSRWTRPGWPGDISPSRPQRPSGRPTGHAQRHFIGAR